jgi:hypothetical protein
MALPVIDIGIDYEAQQGMFIPFVYLIGRENCAPRSPPPRTHVAEQDD